MKIKEYIQGCKENDVFREGFPEYLINRGWYFDEKNNLVSPDRDENGNIVEHET